jgi:N-acyl homoserine lactone hydrolase
MERLMRIGFGKKALLAVTVMIVLMLCSTVYAVDVKVFAFNGGTLKTQTQFIIKDTRVGTPFNIPVPFFLIKHGEDWVAYDTGLNVLCAKDPMAYLGERAKLFYPVMKSDDEFRVQIKKLGLKPENLKAVIISHGHWDHAGSLGNFADTKVPIYFQEREMLDIRKVFDSKQSFQAYKFADFSSLDKMNVKVVNGVFDLFGDGTIVAFPTPGHTFGHQSLMVRKTGEKPLLLTSDALYTMENLERRVPAGSAPDFTAMIQTIDMFKMMSMIGATVIPSHDPDYWSKARLAPQEF